MGYNVRSGGSDVFPDADRLGGEQNTTASDEMKSHTEYLTLNIPSKMAFVNITPQVEEAVRKSGVLTKAAADPGQRGPPDIGPSGR